MIRIEGVTAQYRTISGAVLAVDDVSFRIEDDEIFGIAGESGCGKSTLLKVLYDIIRFPLEVPKGKVEIEYETNGQVKRIGTHEIRSAWWDVVSYVPQAAMSVLNPVYKVEEQFYEVMRRHRAGKNKVEMRAEVEAYLVGLSLPADVLDAYPHQLSGGMRQRVVISLATFLHPAIVLADEPTTALDVVVQRSILMMLMELQEKMHNTFVLVSHDMGVHYQITKRMGIMYAGLVVELGKTVDLFAAPIHPYTSMLISALPRVGDKRLKEGISGAPPPMRNLQPGCRFAPRCPFAFEKCRESKPTLEEVLPGRYAACFLAKARAEEVATHG